MRLRLVTVAVLAAVTLSGCADDDGSDERKAATVAAEARAHIDALAARVGSNPEPQEDTLTSCVPGNDSSGQMLSYSVRVTVDEDSVYRLRGEIADDLAAEGWTVKPRSSDSGVGESVAFQKDATTMGASIFVDKGYASVSGSGGCVE